MSLELLLWPPPVGVDPAALEGEKEEPVYTHSTKYHVIGASPDFLSVLPCFVEINSSSNERKAVFFESGAQTEPYAELTNGSRTKHDNQIKGPDNPTYESLRILSFQSTKQSESQ